jgi:two-component system, OmpR family, phosphate regulon sensor histidine kinase PhoR
VNGAAAAADEAEAATELEGRDTALLARRRTSLALATMLGLLVALAAVAVFASDRLYTSAQNRYVREAFPLRADARDLLVQMLNQETAVRGYLITADRTSLAPYTKARPAAASDIAALRVLSARRPEIATEVATIGGRVRSIESYFAAQIALVASGRAGQLGAQAHVLDGKARFDRFRATATALSAHAAAIVAQSERSQHRTLLRALALVLGLAGVAAAIGVGLLLLVPRRLQRLYRSEQEARRAAERGDRASRSLAHVDDAVVLIDPGGVVRYWNPAAALAFGVAEAEAIDRPVQDVVPEIGTVERELARGGVVGLAPLVREGEERWFAVSESRFPDGRVLVLRNVTAEQELERGRADFIATASHELRTPLAAVYGAVRTLRRDDRPGNAELDERLLEMIEQEAERLNAIVAQILVSAELDRRELHLERDRSELGELCESVLASARLRIGPKHELVLDAGDPVLVDCDPARLRQVLANLVDNALKYSPHGGAVEVRVRRQEPWATVAVTDQGLGIAPGAQARVFEKFYRADVDMIGGIGGSGLGLYISRAIVEQMGGRLTVSSRLGAGSTFTVALPLPPEERSGADDA